MVPCVTSPVEKVKTSMLLIWAGPDGEDIYDNFNLPPHQANDVDYVLQHVLKSFVSQSAISEHPDLNSPKFLNVRERISIHSITEY